MEVWKIAFREEKLISTCGELGKINTYDVEECEKIGQPLKTKESFATCITYVYSMPNSLNSF